MKKDFGMPGIVLVKWDYGSRGIYRMGFEGKYDLKLTDIPGEVKSTKGN